MATRNSYTREVSSANSDLAGPNIPQPERCIGESRLKLGEGYQGQRLPCQYGRLCGHE